MIDVGCRLQCVPQLNSHLIIFDNGPQFFMCKVFEKEIQPTTFLSSFSLVDYRLSLSLLLVFLHAYCMYVHMYYIKLKMPTLCKSTSRQLLLNIN